jgi:hypothetical protein
VQTLLTLGDLTQESLRAFLNNLVFAKHVNREFSDRFGNEGAKVGDTTNIRLPIRSLPTSGQGLQLQDMNEQSIPLTLTTQYQRAIQFSSSELKLSVDDFANRYIARLMEGMANQVDYDGLGQYVNVYNEVGTPGTLPTNDTTPLAAGQRLNEEAAAGDRVLIMNPAINASLVHGMAGFFNPQVTISKQFTKGMISANTLGFDWFMDQNARIQTVGPLGGTPTVNATAGQTGSSLVTTGWTAAAASRLNVGDVFTIGSGATGVYAVNPQNYQSTGQLRQFVVTAPFSSDGSGNGTISISPAIIVTGPYQTVVAAPAALATINVNGAAGTATGRGLAFTKDAFAFVTADLPLPGGADIASRKSDKQLGLSMRCIRMYDINTDRFPLRIDLLGGWGTLYPQAAVRIAS